MATASRPSTTTEPDSPRTIAAAVERARIAQRAWAARPIHARQQLARAMRHHLARYSDAWVDSVTLPQRHMPVETLGAEVVPLADACRWLERHAARVLRQQHMGRATRWLSPYLPGLQIDVQRAPYGVVLIIGTWNYPLLLVGVQALQALVAGNAVVLKPGANSAAAALQLQSALGECGLPHDLCQVLGEEASSAEAAIAAGVDHIVLTGSATTGQAVLRDAAERLTPCTLELSGCDAVFVRADADSSRAAQCIAFGMRWNGSASCIAPRRVFVHERVASAFRNALCDAVRGIRPMPVDARIAARARTLITEALEHGAVLRTPWSGWRNERAVEPVVLEVHSPDYALLASDVFAPVLTMIVVQDDEQALAYDRACPYALGAAIFAKPQSAQRLAARIDAGCITINDLLAPTADPRVPFGGTKRSGYGVTRGAEGLLEMTRVKCVTTRYGRWLPHLEPLTPAINELYEGYLRFRHAATLRERWQAAWQMCRAAVAHQRSRTNSSRPPSSNGETLP